MAEHGVFEDRKWADTRISFLPEPDHRLKRGSARSCNASTSRSLRRVGPTLTFLPLHPSPSLKFASRLTRARFGRLDRSARFPRTNHLLHHPFALNHLLGMLPRSLGGELRLPTASRPPLPKLRSMPVIRRTTLAVLECVPGFALFDERSC